MPDYSYVDQPLFLQFLFYPRPDFTSCPENAFDLMADVEGNARISVRFYAGSEQWPWILYFHGNGEVVSDYDDLALLYLSKQINLVVADYRGYGASTGRPDFSTMVKDAHQIFSLVRKEMEKRHFSSELYIMGRSLGSISALELAYHQQDHTKGLIVESGFASINRLINHLGIMPPNAELDKIESQCLEMITGIKIPALVIHGSADNLVLPDEGRLVYETLGSIEKEMLIIPGAGHNDVIVRDIPKYFDTIKNFVYREK